MFGSSGRYVHSNMKNRLRVLRALHGDSGIAQNDLAILAGIEFYRYHRIEKGRLAPKPEERARIAAAFGVDESELGFPVAADSSESAA